MKISAKTIDAVLPQTQCGLCGFNGCMPYAEALAEDKTTINLCPPGGIAGLLKLAEILQKDATDYLKDMEQAAKPPSVVTIREAECIGCTKCIQACPVDAIIGAAKQMHTVIESECTGCDLCIAPCPVDCIDKKPISVASNAPEHYRTRYQNRNERLAVTAEKPLLQRKNLKTPVILNKKDYIIAALQRTQIKK